MPGKLVEATEELKPSSQDGSSPLNKVAEQNQHRLDQKDFDSETSLQVELDRYGLEMGHILALDGLIEALRQGHTSDLAMPVIDILGSVGESGSNLLQIMQDHLTGDPVVLPVLLRIDQPANGAATKIEFIDEVDVHGRCRIDVARDASESDVSDLITKLLKNLCMLVLSRIPDSDSIKTYVKIMSERDELAYYFAHYTRQYLKVHNGRLVLMLDLPHSKINQQLMDSLQEYVLNSLGYRSGVVVVRSNATTQRYPWPMGLGCDWGHHQPMRGRYPYLVEWLRVTGLCEAPEFEPRESEIIINADQRIIDEESDQLNKQVLAEQIIAMIEEREQATSQKSEFHSSTTNELRTALRSGKRISLAMDNYLHLTGQAMTIVLPPSRDYAWYLARLSDPNEQYKITCTRGLTILCSDMTLPQMMIALTSSQGLIIPLSDDFDEHANQKNIFAKHLTRMIKMIRTAQPNMEFWSNADQESPHTLTDIQERRLWRIWQFCRGNRELTLSLAVANPQGFDDGQVLDTFLTKKLPDQIDGLFVKKCLMCLSVYPHVSVAIATMMLQGLSPDETRESAVIRTDQLFSTQITEKNVQSLFLSLQEKGVVLWDRHINQYVIDSAIHDALLAFLRMQHGALLARIIEVAEAIWTQVATKHPKYQDYYLAQIARLRKGPAIEDQYSTTIMRATHPPTTD